MWYPVEIEIRDLYFHTPFSHMSKRIPFSKNVFRTEKHGLPVLFAYLYYHQYTEFCFHSGNIYFWKKHLALELCDSDFEVTCLAGLTSREAVVNLGDQLKG